LRYAFARRTIIIGDDHHRFRKWTGTPHSHTIAERGAIREPSRSSFPERPTRLYYQSTRLPWRGA
jgi:hypothetical protein